ncbi:MAG: hypothetical protein ABI626_03310 [Sphingomicrobium sp.]
MKPRAAIAAAALLAIPVPAQAVDVATFLKRVDALQRLGPLALLSPDFRRLKHLVEADGDALKADYARAKADNRPTGFCPPAGGKPRFSKDEFLAGANAVPVDQRATTDTKDVLRVLLARKYPCPA